MYDWDSSEPEGKSPNPLSGSDCFSAITSVFIGADEILNEMATAAGGGGDIIAGVTSFEDGEEDGSISLDQIKQSYVMQVERGPDANAGDLEGGDSQGMPLVGVGCLVGALITSKQ